MVKELLNSVEKSHVASATEQYERLTGEGVDAWAIHLSLFPVVQRVLNPPFINPHLPKMYRICRELASYLRAEEIPALVQLELTEYARRPKLELLSKPEPLTSPVSFEDVESAIRDQDGERTASLMAAFYSQKGADEFARRVIIVGSGYLDDSLGHSVSCTAFILLEMMDRSDQDPWPALAALADYFCKGGFQGTPKLRKLEVATTAEALHYQVLRATSGGGIVNLHQPITLYAIERMRHLLNKEEFEHMIAAWIAFMREKNVKEVSLEGRGMEEPADYPLFFETFSTFDAKTLVASVAGMLASKEGRQRLGRFLVRSLCDHYQGDYNPHYLTGLGTVLWLLDQYWNQPPIATNALHQYLDFVFDGLRSGS